MYLKHAKKRKTIIIKYRKSIYKKLAENRKVQKLDNTPIGLALLASVGNH